MHESDDQLEGHALSSTAPTEQAKCLTLFEMKRYVVQDALCTERLRHSLEFHRDRLGFVHIAVSGKRKKMNLINKTSATMISREDTTTLLVAASPTPWDPLSVV